MFWLFEGLEVCGFIFLLVTSNIVYPEENYGTLVLFCEIIYLYTYTVSPQALFLTTFFALVVWLLWLPEGFGGLWALVI